MPPSLRLLLLPFPPLATPPPLFTPLLALSPLPLPSPLPPPLQVLERVLLSAVADEDPSIRHAILAGLSPPFDARLARDALLELLCLSAYDHHHAVRAEGVALLGRVSPHNLARALPILRSVLMDLLSEIETGGPSPAAGGFGCSGGFASGFGGFAARREGAAALLSRLVCSAPHFISPYAPAVLRALLPLLRENDAEVATSALAALGELSVVTGGVVGPMMPQLLPRVLVILKDQAPSSPPPPSRRVSP